MRHPLLLPISLLALTALGACNKDQTETVNDTIGDPMENQLAHAAPVELPPALKESKTFRCKDNSLVYVDFFQGDKLVNLRTEKTGAPKQLKAAEAGQPYEADGGYKVEGGGSSVTVTLPGKDAQLCKS